MNQKVHADKNIMAAIDLGSSHCLTLIASRNLNTNEARIVGVGNVPSKGVRRAGIVNLEEAMRTIERSVETAEQMCGANIDSAYLSISGQHISSMNSKGLITITGENENIGITESDVDRAMQSARAVSLPADREIVNLIPRFYTIDSQEGIRDPLGMVGVRLETLVHIITCSSSALRNFEKALNDIDLGHDAFVFSGLVASEVVLNEADKEAGAVCIDLGSDTTNICAYVEGAIEYSGVIPIGARYITQDINAYTKIGLENAEKIKRDLSDEESGISPQRPDETREEYRRRIKTADLLNLSAYDPHIKAGSMSKNTLIRSVIVPREKEIFSLIYEELRKQKIIEKLGAGAVIVGGGAKTVALIETAGKTLGMQVRVGIPQGIKGLTKHTDDPIYATAIGLLSYGLKEQTPQAVSNNDQFGHNSTFSIWLNHFKQNFKKFMP